MKVSNVRSLSANDVSLVDLNSDAPIVAKDQLEVIRGIGVGSFSTVSLCWHTPAHDHTKSKVAVKYVRPEVLNNPIELQLFLKEIKILQKVQHRCIIKLLGVGPPIAADLPPQGSSCCNESGAQATAVGISPAAGTFACPQPNGFTAIEEADCKQVPSFLVQDFMPGGALNRVVAADMVRTPWERSSYTMADSMRWVINIAEALAYLHSQEPKIIHRDLKLSNILLTSTKRREAEARVADFGLHTLLPEGGHQKQQLETPMSLCSSHITPSAANQLQQSPVHHPKHCCCRHEADVVLVDNSSDSGRALGSRTGPTLPTAVPLRHTEGVGIAIHKDVDSVCCCDVSPSPFGVVEPPATLLETVQEHASGTKCLTAFPAAHIDSLVATRAAVAANCKFNRAQSAKVLLLQQSTSSRRLRFRAKRSLSLPPLLSRSASEKLRRSFGYLPDPAQPADAAGEDSMSASSSALELLHLLIEESCHDALTHRGTFGRSFRQRYRQLLRSQQTYPPTVNEQTVSNSSNSVTSRLAGSITGFLMRQNSLASVGEVPETAPAHIAASRTAGSIVSRDVVEDALFQLTPKTGSLVYMAPEVYRGESYNEKADVFSFGVMLYELLHYQLLQLSVGAVANDGQAALELFAASMAEEGFRPPISPKLPSQLQDLIRDCWAQWPENRPSMTVVLDKLKTIQQELGLDPATLKQQGAGKTAGSWFGSCFSCMASKV